MDVYNYDVVLKNMRSEAANRERELMEYYRDIANTRRENNYLQCQRDDFQKYRDYIVKTKKDQYESLRNISDHLDKIVEASADSKDFLRDLYKDQSKILNEMDTLQNDLGILIKK